MDIRQLRYFLAVAETGHVTRAATQLGIQQPPLSQTLKQLEEQLGLTLFDRHPRGVTLTDAGRLLREGAQRVVEDLARLQQRLADHASGQVGELAVGFTSSAAAHACTPALLRACRERFPDLALKISEDHAAGLTEDLLARRVQVALLRVPVAAHDELVYEPLLHEPVWLALPLDHPLARGDAHQAVPLADLQGLPLILVRQPGAPGLYANLLALCSSRGIQPVVVNEVDRMMTNLNLVAAGAGATVVPASMRGTHAHAIHYRPLRDAPELDAPLTLTWRRAEGEQGPTGLFVALAREIAAQYRAPDVHPVEANSAAARRSVRGRRNVHAAAA